MACEVRARAGRRRVKGWYWFVAAGRGGVAAQYEEYTMLKMHSRGEMRRDLLSFLPFLPRQRRGRETGEGREQRASTSATREMSYPTNNNTQWEPPQVETMVLPPRRRSIIREEGEDGNFEEKTAPLERWSQVCIYVCIYGLHTRPACALVAEPSHALHEHASSSRDKGLVGLGTTEHDKKGLVGVGTTEQSLVVSFASCCSDPHKLPLLETVVQRRL